MQLYGALQDCENLAVAADQYIGALRVGYGKQAEQNEVLSKQVLSLEKRNEHLDAWYRSPILWSVIGAALGGALVYQIQK